MHEVICAKMSMGGIVAVTVDNERVCVWGEGVSYDDDPLKKVTSLMNSHLQCVDTVQVH